MRVEIWPDVVPAQAITQVPERVWPETEAA
jgi:hypothetical protein